MEPGALRPGLRGRRRRAGRRSGRSLRLKAKHQSAKFKGVSATEAGKVQVVAFGPLGDRGKPGRAGFKALRKATTRLLSYKELGYATPFVKELGPKGKKGH